MLLPRMLVQHAVDQIDALGRRGRPLDDSQRLPFKLASSSTGTGSAEQLSTHATHDDFKAAPTHILRRLEMP